MSRLAMAIELLSVEVQNRSKYWAYTNEAPFWVRPPESWLGIYPGQEILHRVQFLESRYWATRHICRASGMKGSSIARRFRFTAENSVEMRCCRVGVVLLIVRVPRLDWGKMGRLPCGRYNSINTCQEISSKMQSRKSGKPYLVW